MEIVNKRTETANGKAIPIIPNDCNSNIKDTVNNGGEEIMRKRKDIREIKGNWDNKKYELGIINYN